VFLLKVQKESKMKKGITMFLSGLIVGIVITVLAIVIVLPKQMFVVHESKLGFEETVDAITASAAENKWSIPHQYDLQKTMKKHGFDVKPVKVFSLCKPEHAYEVLKGNEERLASALMPCRIAVYEKDGKTYVSMLNSGLFSKFMGTTIKEVMGAASRENKLLISPVVLN
jgi:uncharacterized protein (DUF302 family)